MLMAELSAERKRFKAGTGAFVVKNDGKTNRYCFCSVLLLIESIGLLMRAEVEAMNFAVNAAT